MVFLFAHMVRVSQRAADALQIVSVAICIRGGRLSCNISTVSNLDTCNSMI